ncbi:unnamed protein product [Adineta steineri]|uniref:VWFA domain-containing protein n=1 Tax=Adineta steineri TaxID=433720 RepID=A0A814I9J8_9BILA|nr:unnamed protein product [Adineta steineri]CAF1111884.1 unnamed protein product [Adineta steineri]
MQLVESHSNTILAVESNAVMASFTPSEEDCQRVMSNTDITNEFIFVVDCSGSMNDENKIELARQAMLLFLKSLPMNCYFNIIRFGSNHQGLFSETTAVYNEANAQKAEQLTKTMKADLGGTELLTPLQWLDKNPPIQGRARQIFLLTDGEVSNVDEVVDLCRTMATSTRIFSFGLGSSPSRSLVKGLARATNGRFVFIPPHTSVDVHIGEQLQKALQLCITNVKVQWSLGTEAIITAPTNIPPVYADDRLIVYALIQDKSARFDHNSTVLLATERSQLGKAKVTYTPAVSNDKMIARLAAKALILELQHEKLPSSTQKNNTGSLQTRFKKHHNDDEATKELTKKRIIELSLKYNILSPHTAFVGVEKRMDTSNADMVLREVLIQISADDQHLQINSPMPSLQTMNSNVDLFDIFTTQMCHTANANVSHYSPLQMTRSMPAFDCLCADFDITTPLQPTNKLSNNSFKSALSSAYMLNDFDPFYQNVDKTSHNVQTQADDVWPTNGQDIIRQLIDKQKFDGSWDLDSKSLERLTGKPLTAFQHLASNQILTPAIVIAVFETRFAMHSSMWYGIVQKARKRLVDLLGKDVKKLDTLLAEIRKQL